MNPNFNDSNNAVALEAGAEVMKIFMLNST